MAVAAIDPDSQEISITPGRIKVMVRAYQGHAGEELADMMLTHAKKLFGERKDQEAMAWRDAADFAASWAKNERQAQSELEKRFGRYDA